MESATIAKNTATVQNIAGKDKAKTPVKERTAKGKDGASAARACITCLKDGAQTRYTTESRKNN